MRVNLGIWSKLNRLVLFLFVLAGLAAVGSSYIPLIQQNEAYRRDILTLDRRIAEEELKARQLKAAIESVQHDPRTLERLAREKLGYARTNETVIRFEPPAAARR